MRAFFIGLLFLIAVSILAGIGILLFPFLIALALFLRLIVIILLIIFAIWLLGKFIILVWGKMKK